MIQARAGRIARPALTLVDREGAIEAKPHIAVVDDDREIREPLARYLARSGFRVSQAGDAGALERLLASAHIDLIVLDIMLPGEDGLAICRRMQHDSRIPIILLTALSEDVDRIVGLELGADDYLGKPFNPREIVARIRSVLRRAEMLPHRRRRLSGRAVFDRWTFDYARKEVSAEDGVAVRLSTGERLLLASFVEHPGVILTRDQLLDLTRSREGQPFERSVDMQVSRLRRKLERDRGDPQIIRTDWGGGYVFAAEVTWLD